MSITVCAVENPERGFSFPETESLRMDWNHSRKKAATKPRVWAEPRLRGPEGYKDGVGVQRGIPDRLAEGNFAGLPAHSQQVCSSSL